MAVLRLTRDQQATFMVTAPEMFTPASTGWGRLGSTIVRLEAADEAMLRDALATAWRNVTNAAANAVKIADAFMVAEAAGVANVAAVGEIVAKVANVDDPGAVSDLTAEVANVRAVSVGDAVHEANVADIGVEVAHVRAADIPDACKVADAAVTAKSPDAPVVIANVTDVNVTGDDLQSVIDRLQVYWR
jgi:hypothetical protein